MNSLNLLSTRVIGQMTLGGTRPRSRSQGEILHTNDIEEPGRGRSYSDDTVPKAADRGFDLQTETAIDSRPLLDDDVEPSPTQDEDMEDEKHPLVEGVSKNETSSSWPDGWKTLVTRIADVLTAILKAIGAPVVFIARYSPFPRNGRRDRIFLGSTGNGVGLSHTASDSLWKSEKPINRVLQDAKLRHSCSNESLNSTTSESDLDRRKVEQKAVKTKSQPREKSGRDEPESRSSSIRIKEQQDPALRRRKQKRGTSPLGDSGPLTVDSLKSPTSPSSLLKLTRYPHAPHPPRPLIPRRQPSYSNLVSRSPSRGISAPQQKTLVLDLDETLIHSLAKGGRMSSGHMVEVKLNAPVALAPPQPGQPAPMIEPQHPILYYLHKRPHCEEFLRKVSKWYKLVVFTASVQEYADPVIDWLEQERKYFVGRYYRQHCTFRNGSYIKDLSSIEPDLTKVIILDNSPVSYVFHEGQPVQ